MVTTEEVIHVDFKSISKKEPSEPHITGTAKCVACENTWEGVAPIGVDQLECPKCKLMRGYFYNAIGMAGAELFICDCGSEILSLVRKNDEEFLLCLRCGVVHTWA